jgi:3,4-dihydroxy-2-butanone 4-phosphate synthase
MARVPDLVRFCKMRDLKMVTVTDLVRFRLKCDYEVSVLYPNGFATY